MAQPRETRSVSPDRFRRRVGAPNVPLLVRWLFPVVLIVAPVTVVAQAVPAIAYEKYTLPNGLEVILAEDHVSSSGRGQHLVQGRVG